MDNYISIIKRFIKYTIRSEDEVRSKLIVPLTEAMGYSPSIRGEDFPVYSFHGRKKMPTTSADFVLFNDNRFNHHDKNNSEDIDWIRNHSLLVIEAKKPDEMPNVSGQAQFYAMWLRALAYIVTDGKVIKGWMLNDGAADELVIDTTIEESSDLSQLGRFDYGSLIRIKEKRVGLTNGRIITDESELNLSPKVINYMKKALGRNAEGLDNLKIVSRYLNSCDYILQNNVRFDIPAYAINLLRGVYDASLFLDNNIICTNKGKLYHSYWETIDKYQYDSESIRIFIVYDNDQVKDLKILFNFSSDSVDERISKVKLFFEIANSKSMTLVFGENLSKQIVVENEVILENAKGKNEIFYTNTEQLTFLNMLKEIEDYYHEKFTLTQIEDEKNTLDAIFMVFNGIHKNKNSYLTIPKNDLERTVIDNPIILREGEIPNMSDKTIFGITFHPSRTILLPGDYSVSPDVENVDLSICCEYEVLKHE